ncbi:MAG: alpha/beta hydrolase [Gemmatimonadetes bacterium]|nr:alpha/beta hydrolase [Gemmatimonadota bacterium]
MTTPLMIRSGGEGDAVLLLLHGLGATGDVWDGVVARLPGRWPGAWMVPDLPGHGGSAALPSYSFGHLAAAVAAALPPGRPVTVVGHSLGGVVGLALASGWFGVSVAAVAGVGIKVVWSEEDLARSRALAARPNPRYATRQEAAERHLKVAGLAGLVAPEAVPDGALVRRDAEWTLAFDPAAFGVGAPDLPGLLAAARAPVVLATGERDPMSPPDHLRALGVEAVVLPGLGHNAHVEGPDAVLALIDRLRAAD